MACVHGLLKTQADCARRNALYTQLRSVTLPRLCLTATAGTYLVRGSDRLLIMLAGAVTYNSIYLAKTLVRAAAP
jgi:hypothetical protein